MSPSPQLAPPGSSMYTSPTMFVGDGTWDSQRNTFLLPNLQGLNFDTMRYNGMGNRFAEVPQYFILVRAHGIMAAIVFLFVVPTAIFINRFQYRNPYTALRLHIWLQIITILLTTVIFILGFFAVGPQRSLTNPHHGIGVAIYVLVLVQFIGGWWVHSREKRKRLMYIPLKLVLHKWFGRTIALLGIVQIPLGLTLYGSPLYLFILYTLVTLALLFIYFILQYRLEKRRGRDDSNYGYASGSGSVVDERQRPRRFGTLAKGAAAGVGLAALANRLRGRSDRQDDPEVVGSRRHSGSYVDEEKYSQYGRDPGREGGFKEKLLGIGVIAAAAYWITRRLGRKNEDDHDSEETVTTEDSVTRMERVEEGRPPSSSQHPLNQPPTAQPLTHRRSTSSVSYSDYMSAENERRQGHGLRNATLGLGAVGFARNLFKKRRERKEERRVEALRRQEIEDERLARAHSKKYTGDGAPPRRGGHRTDSVADNLDYANEPIRHAQGLPPPPPPGGSLPMAAAGAAAGAAFADRNRQPLTSNPVLSGAPPPGPVQTPLIPSDPQGVLHHDSSGSEMYTSVNGGTRHRHRSYGDAAAAGAAGAAAGLVAGEALSSRRRDRSRHHSASAGEDSVGSPPVSVKVKMHSDGRHVTLRRLPEEEAAAERAARRSSRDPNGRRRRGDSVSSLGGPDNGLGGERWRRTEDLERQQAMDMERERQQLHAAQAQINAGKLAVPMASSSQPQSYYPPPPPIPSSSSPLGPGSLGPGSVGSPGTETTDYSINRKRRRAERAQAKLAREGRGQGVVEYN